MVGSDLRTQVMIGYIRTSEQLKLIDFVYFWIACSLSEYLITRSSVNATLSRLLSSMSTTSTLHTPPAQKSPEYREYIPAGAFDDRSPCPALNTLANHGYMLSLSFTRL